MADACRISSKHRLLLNDVACGLQRQLCTPDDNMLSIWMVERMHCEHSQALALLQASSACPPSVFRLDTDFYVTCSITYIQPSSKGTNYASV